MFKALRKRERDGGPLRLQGLYHGCVWPAGDKESMKMMKRRFGIDLDTLDLEIEKICDLSVQMGQYEPNYRTKAFENGRVLQAYKDDAGNIWVVWQGGTFTPQKGVTYHASLDFQQVFYPPSQGIIYNQISLSTGGLNFSAKGSELCEVKEFKGRRRRKRGKIMKNEEGSIT